MIPKKAVLDLQKLFLDKYGVKLTQKDVLQEASELLYMYAFSKEKFHLLDTISALQFEDISYHKE